MDIKHCQIENDFIVAVHKRRRNVSSRHSQQVDWGSTKRHYNHKLLTEAPWLQTCSTHQTPELNMRHLGDVSPELIVEATFPHSISVTMPDGSTMLSDNTSEAFGLTKRQLTHLRECSATYNYRVPKHAIEWLCDAISIDYKVAYKWLRGDDSSESSASQAMRVSNLLAESSDDGHEEVQSGLGNFPIEQSEYFDLAIGVKGLMSLKNQNND